MNINRPINSSVRENTETGICGTAFEKPGLRPGRYGYLRTLQDPGRKNRKSPGIVHGNYNCYLYQDRAGKENILVIAPHKDRIPSAL